MLAHYTLYIIDTYAYTHTHIHIRIAFVHSVYIQISYFQYTLIEYKTMSSHIHDNFSKIFKF